MPLEYYESEGQVLKMKYDSAKDEYYDAEILGDDGKWYDIHPSDVFKWDAASITKRQAEKMIANTKGKAIKA